MAAKGGRIDFMFLCPPLTWPLDPLLRYASRGVCPNPLVLTFSGGHCSGGYASYWNVFLLILMLLCPVTLILPFPKSSVRKRLHGGGSIISHKGFAKPEWGRKTCIFISALKSPMELMKANWSVEGRWSDLFHS